MIEVQSGETERLYFYRYDRKPLKAPLPRSLVVLGDNLWPAIVSEGLGDHTYARSALASCVAARFLQRRGLDAQPVTAILHMSTWIGDDLLHPRTKDFGRPDSSSGIEAPHVVCRVRHRRSTYVIDATIRQGYEPGLCLLPPEVAVVGTPPNASHHVPPEIGYEAPGFAFATRAHFRQWDDRVLRAVWLLDQDGREDWRASPDADPERHAAVCERIDWAWNISLLEEAPLFVAA